ncbi:MAG: mercuric reductase [Gemmatimonadales bacterium]|nr:mercuric reductase [Gemmatimonadales bacterium]
MKTFQAIVIGSGQAGNPLAHRLADKGWTVALIEREHLGGSCINYGCTPTKTMLASAQIAHYARRAADFGVRVGPVTVDLATVVSRKNAIVQQWRSGQEKHAAKRPTITVFRGAAQFAAPHAVEVNGEQLTSEHIFINTGTTPLVPPIEGIESVPYLTNRSVMDLTEVPEHLVVVGGSYVGLEFGQMFRRFGSRVTIVEYADRIVPREDADVADALRAALESEGIAFLVPAEATKVERNAAGIRVTVRDRRDSTSRGLDASHILLASGRRSNTDDLGLDAAGIATAGGWVKVNEYLETNVPGVYALGDVTGGPAFTHISYNDFQIVFHNLFNDPKLTTAGRLVPYALFTDPELGRVGMTEKEARASGRSIKVGSIPMSRVARAIERNETAGLMKVVVDADTDRILGAAILGTGGGELVQTLMALMMADAPWTLFYRAVYIHPTTTEGFFALMDSVK